MTLLLAAFVLLSFPVFVALLSQYPRSRALAFAAISALPFLADLPVTGYIYGWAGWSGTVRGIAVSPIDTLALALIITRRRTPGRLSFWSLFALYGIALFASIFAASVWLATVFVWWQYARVLLLFAAVGGESHRLDVRKGLLAGFAVGLMYQAAHVIPQKLGGAVQASGVLGHQNILGLMIELAVLPLVAALLAGNRSKLVIAGIAAALICIAGSGSRGAVGIAGGAIVVLALVSLMRRLSPHKLRVVALGAFALAIATPFALATLNNRFRGASYVTEEAERNSFENAARSMAANHAFGVGANQFVLVSNRDGYAARAGVSWQVADRSVPVHNAYLLARAETGWVGEFAFILLLGAPLVMALRLAFTDRTSASGEVALGSAIALAANILHNNYEFAVHMFNVQALVVINLGVIAALLREKRMARRSPLALGKGRRVEPATALVNSARVSFSQPEQASDTRT